MGIRLRGGDIREVIVAMQCVVQAIAVIMNVRGKNGSIRLIWADELSALLESVQKECEERVEALVREMAEVEGVDEEMKGNEQMAWVQRMEMIRGRAEEIVREEIMG